MKHIFGLPLLAVLSLLLLPNANATSLITGDVTFDNSTNLYTYTYTLDTTTLLNSTVEFSLLQNLGFDFEHPLPVSHTEPEIGDWHFVISVGGLHNSGDQNIYGSFWSWVHLYNAESVSNIGNLVFSFTTERGINTTTENNYFIFNSGATSGPEENNGFIEIGHVVGPDFINFTPIPTPVPEVNISAMMLGGLGFIGFAMRRRKAV